VTGDLVLLPEMQIPRYGHAIGYLNNEVYVIGGTDQTQSPTTSVEKFDMLTQEWIFIAKLNCKRSKALSATSHESSTIYIAGGNDSRTSNIIIEKYSPLSNQWQVIEAELDFIIIPDRTHMLIYNESVKLANDSSVEGVHDPDDKLLFVHYDNIIYPVPDIYFLYLGPGVIEELKYDKTNSTISTYSKTKVLYDKQTKKIFAFSGSNYTVVDYMDFNDEFAKFSSIKFD
jgi:hypothetical protein